MSADEPVDGPHDESAPPRRRRRSRIVLLVLGLLGLLLVALVVMAVPLLDVRAQGTQARTDLATALARLRAGDLAGATASIDSARTNVDAATGTVDGFQADVLRVVPVAGGAVADLRHLVSALDAAVSVAEVGVELYPSVLGEDALLVQDSVVDLTVLDQVGAAVVAVGGHLARAEEDLLAIGGSTPVVGNQIGGARDAALEQVARLQDTLERYRPVLDEMPRLLGTEGPVRYLLTVMNSAELRSSGGATLSIGELVIDQGRITYGDTGSTTDYTDNNEVIAWEPVPGNPWHGAPESKLVNATFSPNWTTSGEELLRAWEATTGSRAEALIAIDVPALSDLFRITGPVEVEGYGNLTANNLVERLIGSYDDFRSPQQRKRVNDQIIPVLRQKLVEGGKFVQKAQAIVRAGQSRHAVAYFRDPDTQSMITQLGLAGDLSTTGQDYLGVFTQNRNASKVDVWERRHIASEVTLAADGSAEVVTTVTLHNDSPPYEQSYPDERRNYFTRWSLPAYVQYLPMGAELAQFTVDGVDRTTEVEQLVERERPFLRTGLTIEPGATAEVVVRYRVPHAAIPVDGGLEYSLDIDPQGLAIPPSYSVLLRLPAGYVEAEVGEEWTVNPDLTLTLDIAEPTILHTTVRMVPG